MALKTNTVEVEIQGDSIILRPVRGVAGALSEYEKGKGKKDFAAVRKEVADKKAGGTH